MPQFHPDDGHGLRGLILISGNYDLSGVTNPDERYRSYFGDDVAKYAERSPFQGLLSTEIPLFVAYGELASLAGYPGAGRAVGTFCARNRFMLLVPCHRVVGATGLGGYGSAGPGVKRRLLALEGVRL